LLTSIGLPGDILQKIVGIMLACGIIGELGNWIAGPNQGMYEAARESYMPKFFAKTTKHGVPIRIMILQSSIVTISALLITFTSGANVDFAFNVSLAVNYCSVLDSLYDHVDRLHYFKDKTRRLSPHVLHVEES
jgi:Amino acid transporters